MYAFFSYIMAMIAIIAMLNNRLFKLPTTIAIMSGSLLLSLAILLLGKFGHHGIINLSKLYLDKLDFNQVLMEGMLSFLLFAGALNIDVKCIWERKLEVALLALGSTIFSCFAIAYILSYVLSFFDINYPFIYFLIFGALISPTDPIAVLARFKTLNANKTIETMVAGESLFNDGIGIVLFITLSSVAFSHKPVVFSDVFLFFIREFFGGISFGLVLGFIGYKILIRTQSVKVDILVTLAICTAGYTAANQLEVSGPLAIVTAGIIIGTIAAKKNALLTNFWEIIDELLNAFLFFFLGLEILVVDHNYTALIIAMISLGVVLIIRYISVSIPMKCLMLLSKRVYPENTIAILSWGRAARRPCCCLSTVIA